MEQRRLRLGDILDDYCPRERRVTNHAVVAMIEEDVKQTRCTTCDAEHAYKGGKEPRRRKKDATSVLYQEVLAGMPEATELSPPAAVPVVAPVAAAVLVDAPAATASEAEPVAEPQREPVDEAQPQADDGPFHRRLIRATLPRPEGQKEVRQVTDFTIRQNGARGNNPYRSGAKLRGHAGGGNGNRPQGTGGRRFGGGGNPGMPGGRSGRPGFGGGNPQRGPSTGSGRGRKRSR